MELGSGKAALLIRLLRRWPGTSAEGFDRNRWFMAEARAAAEAAGVAGRLSLIDTDSPGALLAGRSVDLAIAMGATGIVGEQAATIGFLASIVGPGGQVVFGDGAWVAEPDPAGLAAFGMARDELVDGAEGIGRPGQGRRAGGPSPSSSSRPRSGTTYEADVRGRRGGVGGREPRRPGARGLPGAARPGCARAMPRGGARRWASRSACSGCRPADRRSGTERPPVALRRR